MVFAMTQIEGDDTLLEHRLNILGRVENDSRTSTAIATVLDMQSVVDKGEFLFPWYIWAFTSQYTEYFELLGYFFHDLTRSGKYFMSGARYANAALHCVDFLFDTRFALISINMLRIPILKNI